MNSSELIFPGQPFQKSVPLPLQNHDHLKKDPL